MVEGKGIGIGIGVGIVIGSLLVRKFDRDRKKWVDLLYFSSLGLALHWAQE